MKKHLVKKCNKCPNDVQKDLKEKYFQNKNNFEHEDGSELEDDV